MQISISLAAVALSLMPISAAEFPSATINNGSIHAKIYLPDADKGFYRGTRFDWSGVVYSLETQGHNFYGPWFNKTDPSVHDFIYQGEDIVAGPCSATTGPVDEFKPLGWDEAKPGSTFVKIGVGALRKPAAGDYDNYHLYEIADGGKWSVHTDPHAVRFTQALNDTASGYGYVYTKALTLTAGKPEMVLQHTLKNTGKLPIKTSVYNHNFLVLDGKAPGPGLAITVPFSIHSPHPPEKNLAEIRGSQIVYLQTLKDHDTVATPMNGFGPTEKDNHIKIENSNVGAGMTIQTDRPLLSESLWSIRTVVAVEPFVEIDIEPGQEFTWTTQYHYYKLPAQGH